MHPALSIILFTTSSGAGFALVALLGVGAPLGLLPTTESFAFTALAAAFVLAGGGLLSSVFHLGHPERAWRALSQWRSSWLSREGVFSILTFLPAALFGVGWIFFRKTSGLVGFCGILAAALALITIYCTGMIYGSLKPIGQWHNQWVVPNYLALGLMSGSLVLHFIERLWVGRSSSAALLSVVLVVIAWWMKERYWRDIDTSSSKSTVASATALGSRGTIRMFEAPHTQDNYLLKEMGYRIARQHRIRLRQIARSSGFAFPAIASLLAVFLTGPVGTTLAGLGAASAAVGIVIERWLFFAEAKHTILLYYGVDTV
jgi:sulfite dehydrogenase (quinone) subunit SoeC